MAGIRAVTGDGMNESSLARAFAKEPGNVACRLAIGGPADGIAL